MRPDERHAAHGNEQIFQRKPHHDLPPQISHSQKIFIRRKRVAIMKTQIEIGEFFPKKPITKK